MRGNRERDYRPAPGTDAWWDQQAHRCDARGAGVTGMVVLDGIGFRLGSHTPLPSVTLTEVGGALAAWLQTDPSTFTGYRSGPGGIN